MGTHAIRKVLTAGAVAIFTFSIMTAGFAAEPVDKAQEAARKKASEAEMKRQQEERKRAEERSKIAQAARDKLNYATWDIHLTQMTANPKKDVFDDKVVFEANKVRSEKLSSQGFGATNYTVTLSGDTIVWETMQSSGDKGIAFWKGEINGDAMSGVMSRHLPDTTIKDYTFISMAKKVMVPPPPPQENVASQGSTDGGTAVAPAQKAVKAPADTPKVAAKAEPAKTEDKNKKGKK